MIVWQPGPLIVAGPVTLGMLAAAGVALLLACLLVRYLLEEAF